MNFKGNLNHFFKTNIWANYYLDRLISEDKFCAYSIYDRLCVKCNKIVSQHPIFALSFQVRRFKSFHSALHHLKCSFVVGFTLGHLYILFVCMFPLSLFHTLSKSDTFFFSCSQMCVWYSLILQIGADIVNFCIIYVMNIAFVKFEAYFLSVLMFDSS